MTVGTNNFLIFDQNKLNIVDDNAYQQSSYRQNGATTGVAPSTIHNKMYYQSSIMTSAMGQVFANKGYNVSDSDFNNLVSVLSNIVTKGEIAGKWKASAAYNLGEVVFATNTIDNTSSMKFFECTTGGTSGTNEPSWGAVGTIITDGTCQWKVCDIRQGTSIGKIPALVDVGGGISGLPAISGKLLTDITNVPTGTIMHVLSKTVPAGYLKVNGAAISRTAYANLVNNTFITIPTIGNTTIGNATITNIPTTIDMAIGMPVEGAGIPAGSTIISINSLTSITISANTTATATSATITVFPYGNGDGSTTVNLPDLRGEHLRAFDDGRNADTTALVGTTTSGSAVITALSYTGFMFVGMYLSGTGILAGATVASITSATAITISANATATATGIVITFTGRRFGSWQDSDNKSHYHDYWTSSSDQSYPHPSGNYPIAQLGYNPNRTLSTVQNIVNSGGAEARGRNYSIPVYIKY